MVAKDGLNTAGCFANRQPLILGWHGTPSIRVCRLRLSSASVPEGQGPFAVSAVNANTLPPTVP